MYGGWVVASKHVGYVVDYLKLGPMTYRAVHLGIASWRRNCSCDLVGICAVNTLPFEERHIFSLQVLVSPRFLLNPAIGS
jgi:hypothetical protein